MTGKLAKINLTSLFGVHLGLEILRGHIELRLLVHGGPRFTFTTAAVTAATQATAEVAASCQATEDKQRLWTTRDSGFNTTTSSRWTLASSVGHRSSVKAGLLGCHLVADGGRAVSEGGTRVGPVPQALTF